MYSSIDFKHESIFLLKENVPLLLRKIIHHHVPNKYLFIWSVFAYKSLQDGVDGKFTIFVFYSIFAHRNFCKTYFVIVKCVYIVVVANDDDDDYVFVYKLLNKGIIT